jgi:hypothetical protein
MIIELRVEVAGEAPRDYAFNSAEVVIGCHPFNQVVILTPGAAARHGRFLFNGDGHLEYEDLRSVHGSKLRRGGLPVASLPPGAKRALRAGDQVSIGVQDQARITLTNFSSPAIVTAPEHLPLPSIDVSASALLAGLDPSLQAEAIDVASNLLMRAQMSGACASLCSLLHKALLADGAPADARVTLSLAFTLTLDSDARAAHDWVLTCDGAVARDDLHAPFPHAHLRSYLRPGFITLKPRLDREAPPGAWAALCPISAGAAQGDAFLRLACSWRPQGRQRDTLVATLAYFIPHLRLLITDELRARKGAHFLHENQYFRARLRRRYAPKALSSGSASMQQMLASLETLCVGREPVLVVGEAGCGKQLYARTLHDLGPRGSRLFIAQRCAEHDADSLDVELFGEVGADGVSRYGLFEVIDGGTLFLDDIDRLPLALQGKLMRVLTEREIRRQGDPMAMPVDVRLVAACCRPLLEQVERGLFRRDLFSILSRAMLSVPPLRERVEDILPLARSFCHGFNSRYRLAVEALDSGAESRLISYSWPGNVRELQVVMETAVMKARSGLITADHLDLRDVASPLANDPADL